MGNTFLISTSSRYQKYIAITTNIGKMRTVMSRDEVNFSYRRAPQAKVKTKLLVSRAASVTLNIWDFSTVN